MRILVTGASGYIGGKMVEALLQKDWAEAVVGTDINQPPRPIPGHVFYQRDIRESLDDIFEREKIDVVVHTAYVLPPSHDQKLMEDINKGGTLNVLNASVKARVRQILYTSSTTAYGFWPDNDTPLTEDSPLRGNDDFIYAKNKKEIEAVLAEYTGRHPETVVSIVRPCFVVGAGFKNPLAEHLRKKVVLLPSKSRSWQFVHEDDLIQVMLLLLEKQTAGIFNVTGPGTMTFPEMVKMLGNILLPLPWSLLYPLNNLAWWLRLSFVTKFPSPPLRMMIHPWVATSAKLIRETGYQFKYDTRAAFGEFVRAVKG
jgi:UDP-glucose 4-epimerase